MLAEIVDNACPSEGSHRRLPACLGWLSFTFAQIPFLSKPDRADGANKIQAEFVGVLLGPDLLTDSLTAQSPNLLQASALSIGKIKAENPPGAMTAQSSVLSEGMRLTKDVLGCPFII